MSASRDWPKTEALIALLESIERDLIAVDTSRASRDDLELVLRGLTLADKAGLTYREVVAVLRSRMGVKP